MLTRTVTVYSTPKCFQCKMTKQWLTDRGIPFVPVDLTVSPDDLVAVQELGYSSAPVVIVNHGDTMDETHWYGFRPDMLEQFTNNTKAA